MSPSGAVGASGPGDSSGDDCSPGGSSFAFASFTCVSFTGAFFAAGMSTEVLKPVIMVLLLAVAAFVILRPAFGTAPAPGPATRRQILDAVRDRERSVGELVDLVALGQPGVSRHLKVLREAGLVEVRKDAQRRLYRLQPKPLQELDAWLEPYRAHWAARLDSLEQHLQRSARPGRADTSTSDGQDDA